MRNSNTIAAVILGASAGVALLKFYSMPKEERDEFFSHLKNRTNILLDNAEETVEKVEHFMDEIKDKAEGDWMQKLLVLKKMFKDLYGSEKHYLL